MPDRFHGLRDLLARDSRYVCLPGETGHFETDGETANSIRALLAERDELRLAAAQLLVSVEWLVRVYPNLADETDRTALERGRAALAATEVKHD